MESRLWRSNCQIFLPFWNGPSKRRRWSASSAKNARPNALKRNGYARYSKKNVGGSSLVSKADEQCHPWHQSEILRHYIDEYEKRKQENVQSTSEASSALSAFIAWAKRNIDWYDPFIETSDDLFADIDRDTLDIPKIQSW